jgi:predicted HicB family RNase H-like nuclease
MKRDTEGRFIDSPDSLYPKTIGLRISKSRHEKFRAIAEEQGVTIAELARQVIHDYVDSHKEPDNHHTAA